MIAASEAEREKSTLPYNREISTDTYLGTFKQSTTAGEKIGRVLSLVDKLYRDKAIDMEQWMACGTLRNMIMMEMGASEGVSSYGQSVRASEPATKADRKGKMYTGYKLDARGRLEVNADGSIKCAGRKSRSNERSLEDAIIAACGDRDTNGRVRYVDIKHAEILIRIVTHTEDMPTLTGLTLELTSYYGAKSKQAPPFALGKISTWLERLARHFREADRR